MFSRIIFVCRPFVAEINEIEKLVRSSVGENAIGSFLSHCKAFCSQQRGWGGGGGDPGGGVVGRYEHFSISCSLRSRHCI